MRNEDLGGRTDIRHDLALRCVDAEGRSMSMTTTFCYDPADPFAVALTFPTPGLDVVWTFARDLLILGTTEPTGDGDVHVWPSLDANGRGIVVLEFASPDGELTVHASAKDVTAFLARTLQLVPAGTESQHIDVDSLIDQLLAL